MWKNLKNFITKDVSNANEVKMYAVTMRMVLIIFAFYGITSAIISASCKDYIYMLISLLLIPVSAILFWLTYTNRTKNASEIFVLTLVGVIWMNTACYGIETSISQFVYVIILITFAFDYRKLYTKISIVIAILILRVLLIAHYQMCSFGYGYRIRSYWQGAHMVFCTTMVIAIIVMATSDFSEMREKLQKTNIQWRDDAGKDPLTRLNNRRSAQRYIEERLEELGKGEISSMTFVMADIDHFKRVNDTYGHDMGDIVLTSLANVMGAFMRDKGMASRWGGEEFILLFVNYNGDETYQLLTQLQKQISELEFNFNNEPVKITLTFGVAEQGNFTDVEEAIKEADEKLYLGKEKGRNIIVY